MEVLQLTPKLVTETARQSGQTAIHAEKQTLAKFLVTPREAKRLLQSKTLKRLTKRKAESGLERTTYYDTPRFLLKKKGITLRVGQIGKQRVQTVNTDRDFANGTSSHWEISKTLQCDAPELGMVRQVLARGSVSGSALKRLRPVFSTQIHRTRLTLEFGRNKLSLVYDNGDIVHSKSGKVIETISEIEFELKSGSAQEMFKLLCILNEKCTWQQIGMTKAERGYAAISRAHAFRPRKHKEFITSPSSDVFSVMQGAMSSALAHFFANNPNLLSDKPEAIHQTRVAVRRMRAILHSCKSIVSYMDRKALNGELRWLQTKLGECRDWHVLRHDTLPKMKEITPLYRTELDELARKTHTKLLPQSLDVYNSRRAQRLILHIQHWLATLPARGGPPAADVGRNALKTNVRRLRRLGRLTVHKPIAEIHAIRIKSKKIRYTLEILPASGYEDSEALKSLTALQKKLGDLNDIAKCLELSSTARGSELSLEAREQIRVWAETQMYKLIAPARVHYNAVLRWNPEIG
ncbi:MAG: CHAD domain-containing protein [Arenicellales bacterium]|nr:CHAD domain-containing protein [Arenicellales bacterium]